MMKIIFLTQYFPPETGAPQNRLMAMARTLQMNGAEVSVLTAMPNYPEMRIHKGYRGKFFIREKLNGLEVLRTWLLVSRSRNIFWRLSNYFSFVFTSLIVGLFSLRKSDVLFVESPPLFLGITAILLAKAKGAKLVFNVSDLWPESAVQLGLVTNRSMIALSTWLEMTCYGSAALITGQTQGIVENVRARCPGKEVLWLPNGVDLDALANIPGRTNARAELGIDPNSLVLTYAGIIGHAQGLEVIIEAAGMIAEDVRFLLIGDGPEKHGLIDHAARMGVKEKVLFLERMDRDRVLAILKVSDAVVVPLRKNDLFKGAIPSKIFEALALSKPLLLGVDGEARELFIEQGQAGLFFEPESALSLADAIRIYFKDRDLLKGHGESGSNYVRRNFERKEISMRLWRALQRITNQ